MFDIAYEAQATIEAATILRNREWDLLKKLDIGQPMVGFFEGVFIMRMDNIIKYWSIMYSTHGT